jgi:hypothetical protein
LLTILSVCAYGLRRLVLVASRDEVYRECGPEAIISRHMKLLDHHDRLKDSNVILWIDKACLRELSSQSWLPNRKPTASVSALKAS